MTNSRAKLRALILRVAPALERYIERKTYDQFRARLWAAVVRLFEGGHDSSFMATFARSIDVQLTEAWNLGAAEVGVQPDEMNNDDVNILRSIIANEMQFIQGIAGEIQSDVDNGLTREQLESYYGNRVSLWATRYLETQNRARMVFGSKQKFIWVRGPTSDGCDTCIALNGIVAFGWEWEEARFIPQNPPNRLLKCSGWGCLCEIKPTTKRRTARALDRLLTIATADNL